MSSPSGGTSLERDMLEEERHLGSGDDWSLQEAQAYIARLRARQRIWGGVALVLIASLFILVIVLAARNGKGGNDNPSDPAPYKTGDNFIDDINEDRLIANLDGLVKAAATNEYNSRSIATGYNASVEFVKSQLEAKTDLVLSEQFFKVQTYKVVDEPIFNIVGQKPLAYKTQYEQLSYSGSGDVTGTVELVPNTGCEESDFAGFTAGNIALIIRGDCPFHKKVVDASKASAVIIANKPGTGLFRGTLGSSAPYPVFGVGNEFGLALVGQRVRMYAKNEVRNDYTSNLIATTKEGDASSAIVLGTHLDSVLAGPGLNDNGSGSSANLALALLWAELGIKPKNQVRFCWWGAEEIGLLGSYEYIRVINGTGDLPNVALNLNFDMLGSPNFLRGIYNASSGPENVITGSLQIQRLFEKHFSDRGLPYELTPFTGRSDYGPFIEVGIPAGGLDTGAEVIKTAEERALFGGFAGAAFDPCYHQACDTVENVNMEVLVSNTKAAADVLQQLAQMDDVRGFLKKTQ